MGTVPTHRDRTDAEAVVGRLRGVRAVTNELTVILTESHSDETIAADIVSALKRSALVDAGRVDVTVSDGTVTLEGKVRTAAAKSAAYRAADRTAGVIRVADKLTLGFGNGSVGN
jgi:osmotically-inducible protein OsmY